MLGIEAGQVRDQVFHHRLRGQGRNRDDAARQFVEALGAGNRVLAGNIHGAGAADAFTAGAAECQRRVDIVLDVEQHVQDHCAGAIHVHPIGVPAWITALFRAVAINPELAEIGRALRLRPGLALFGRGAFGESKLNHVVLALIS